MQVQNIAAKLKLISWWSIVAASNFLHHVLFGVNVYSDLVCNHRHKIIMPMFVTIIISIYKKNNFAVAAAALFVS